MYKIRLGMWKKIHNADTILSGIPESRNSCWFKMKCRHGICPDTTSRTCLSIIPKQCGDIFARLCSWCIQGFIPTKPLPYCLEYKNMWRVAYSFPFAELCSLCKMSNKFSHTLSKLVYLLFFFQIYKPFSVIFVILQIF